MESRVENEKQMPFWAHLEELRKRIINILIAVAAGFGVCFYFSEDILGLIMLPLNATIRYGGHFPFVHFVPNENSRELFFTTLTEPFMSHMKIGLISGTILAVPVILHQIWKFISPGLLSHERRYAGRFVFFSTIFFGAGVLFCFLFLLPVAIPFLVTYKTEHLKPIIKIGEYIDFTLKFMIASGAVFELPLGMLLLGRMGIITYKTFSGFRKYAFLLSFVLGALITPTPDVFNMTLMSLPIYLLYEFGLFGVRIFGRRKGAWSAVEES